MYGRSDIYGAAGKGFGTPGLDCPISTRAAAEGFGGLEDDEEFGLFPKARAYAKMKRIYVLAGKIQYLVDIGKVSTARKKAEKLVKVYDKLQNIKEWDDYVTDALKDTMAAMTAFADGQTDNPHDYMAQNEASTGSTADGASSAATAATVLRTEWYPQFRRARGPGMPSRPAGPRAGAARVPAVAPRGGRNMHGGGRARFGTMRMDADDLSVDGLGGDIARSGASIDRQDLFGRLRMDEGDLRVDGLGQPIGRSGQAIGRMDLLEGFGALFQRDAQKTFDRLKKDMEEANRAGNPVKAARIAQSLAKLQADWAETQNIVGSASGLTADEDLATYGE